jgi:5-oxoprolinase (ATP-hydrolysing) subunit A
VARLIELNADVGEGGNDEPLFSYVDRVSIACGGHTGDSRTMLVALSMARNLGVMSGAHPGYPDREGFGRRPIAANVGDVRRWIVAQTRELMNLADQAGTRVFHVKPHGALYNRAATDKAIGAEVIEALQELGDLALVCLAQSPLVGWAREAGIMVLEEAFADRRYLADGQLAPRELAGAVIEDPLAASEQAKGIARGEAITTLGGGALRVSADTLCIHGDRVDALVFARTIAAVLDD